MESTIKFKGLVTSHASKEMTKSNDAVYVLHDVKVIEGPLRGKTVTGSRTLVNVEGEEKAPVSIDQEVVLYARHAEDGNWYFNISSETVKVSNEEIGALLDGYTPETTEAQERLEEQSI